MNFHGKPSSEFSGRLFGALYKGFISGLILEAVTQVLIFFDVMKAINGFVFIIFWCVLANIDYYMQSRESLMWRLLVSIGFGALFSGAAVMLLAIQGYSWMLGLSMFVFSVFLSAVLMYKKI